MKKNIIVSGIVIALSLILGACSSSTSSPSSAGEGYSSSFASSRAPETEATADEYFDYDGSAGGESYLEIDENTELSTADESMLTFSLKVDTASYTNVQRYIESGDLPPRDAVRTEELINYFSYDEDVPVTDGPFGIYTELGPSPFDSDKQMAFIRVKSRDIDRESLPASNLTFLIDTSGSMDSHDKLPLLKEAFTLLVETLDENDRVSIVTYAGSSAVILDSASGADKSMIIHAINRLEAGGSTAGADGIRTAYELAEKNFMRGGNNRVILASDGDFNVGISSLPELENFISKKRDSGVYLSVLGFGTGNTRDDVMETLSKNGNGNYSYINSVLTAEKVLVNEMGSNMFTIADDVKAQVEFNPQNVKSFRLIGYENRRLSNRDFNDDTKDAGEIGIGTDVVVMFELELQNGGADELKYSGDESGQTDGTFGEELFEVRIRYKNPSESESNLIIKPVKFSDIENEVSSDYGFACSVAAFGHLLRNSEHTGEVTLDDVISFAKNNLGQDPDGYREEYVFMLREYSDIAR